MGAENVLRVCADPGNLPFSNAQAQGFENRIVAVIASELGRTVEYVWWPQRRGFLRNTVKAGLCDVVPGGPGGMEMVATTRPYYRSGYVLVSRADRNFDLRSLDDPRLRQLWLGVQMIGDDGANAPPAHALARRGIIDNVAGFPVYAAGGETSPNRRIIDAVANGEVDAALVWGPVAGPLVRRSPPPLTLAQVQPLIDGPTLPVMFDISMGLRREDVELKRHLEAALARRRRFCGGRRSALGRQPSRRPGTLTPLPEGASGSARSRDGQKCASLSARAPLLRGTRPSHTAAGTSACCTCSRKALPQLGASAPASAGA